MKLRLYAIKDELNGFTAPIPINNDESAKRYFKEMKTHNATIAIQTGDFSIWYIGEFETENGEITNHKPELIERG